MDDGRGASAEATAPRGGIPLVLAPLLSPYRRHGQLSVRIERLPNGARLSKGRNNGDRTWSLQPDDLDGVLYQPPDGLDEAHTLAVRILSLDGDHGATLAVLDLPVSPNDAEPAVPLAAATPVAPGGGEVHGDSELRRLRDQLTELTARLAVREAELAEARQKLEQAQSPATKQAVEGELAAARATWEAELKERLATSRDTWQAEQGGRFAELEKRADEQIQRAQQRWQQDAKAALAQTEATWKAGEAARLAAAEARWREEATRALADAEARVKRAETALVKAEEAWKANEAARFAAYEARWREESRRSLAELQARLQQAEAALAQAARAAPSLAPREDAERALADARLRAERAEAALAQAQAQSSGDAIEIHVLHDELREVKAALAVRESQLADTRSAMERQVETVQVSPQRQLADQLAALKNDTRVAAVPRRAKGGIGRRLMGMAALLLIVLLGVRYYSEIEAAVLELWQPHVLSHSNAAEPSRAKAPLHHPTSESSRLP